MTRRFQTNLILGGDPRGGLRALRQVQGEMGRTDRGARNVRRSFDDWQRSTRTLNNSLVRLAGVVGVSLSFAGAIRSVQRLASDADGIGKLAERTNFAVEALQEYRFAAEQSGASSQQFDDAIQRLNRRLGLFVQTGAGPAANAINRLGIELTDAAGNIRRTDDVFLEIAERIANLSSVQEQAAVASEFFGDRAGPQLVNLLRQGRIGIEELAEQARATGSILSGEAVDSAQRYADTLNILQRQFQGITVQLFEGLVPALTATAELFVKTTDDSNGLVRAGERIGVALNVAARAAIVVQTAFQAAGQAIGALGTILVGSFQTILQTAQATLTQVGQATELALQGQFIEAGRAIAGTSEAIREATVESRRLTDEGLRGLREDIGPIFERGIGRIQEFADALAKAREEGRDLNSVIRDFGGEGEDGATGRLDGAASAAERLSEALAGQLNSLREQEVRLRGGTRALLNYRLAQAAAAGESAETLALIREQIEAVVEQEDAIERLNAELARTAGAQAARDAFEALRRELAQQITLTAGAGEGLREYQRELFVAEQVAKLGADATAEFREEIERLAGALFDLQFPEDEVTSFASRLSDAFGQGLDRGLEQFFGNLSDRDFDDLLSGNFSDVGRRVGQQLAGSIGQAIGTEFGGPIGGAIGNAIGNIIGGAIFGDKDPKFQIGGSAGFAQTGGRARGSVDTALGSFLFRFRGMDDETERQIQGALVQFGQTIASVIRDGSQRDAIARALDNFAFDSADDGASVEDLLEAQFDVILGTFDSFTRGLVEQGRSLDEQVQRLADVLQIQTRLNLTGANGFASIEAAIASVADLQSAGETLAQAFDRLTGIVAGLDTVAGLTGAVLGDSRAEVFAFGDALGQVFGDDLRRLTGGLDRIVGAFFSDEERIGQLVAQSRQTATELLARLGIEATEQALSQSGFRDIFDDLFGTLSPEDTAILIEAGTAIANLIDAEEELARVRGQLGIGALAEELEAFSRSIEDQILQIISPARFAYEELSRSQQANIDRARALGATEEQLARVRFLSELQTRQFVAGLEDNIRRLSGDLDRNAFDRLGSQIRSTTDNLRDSVIRALDDIRGFLDGSLLDQFSTLTPAERLAEAQRQFDEVSAAVLGGDLSRIGELTGLAQQLREQGASFSGTASAEFLALEQSIRSTLEQVAGINVPGGDQPPTSAQADGILDATRSAALSAAEEIRIASQIVDEIAVLARISERSPAEIADELGVSLGRVLQSLTGQALTGDLESAFNELVFSTDAQISELRTLEELLETDGVVQEQALRVAEEHVIIADQTRALIERAGATAEAELEEMRQLRAEVARLAESQAATNALLAQGNSLAGEQIRVTADGLRLVVDAEGRVVRELERTNQPGTRRKVNA